MFVYSFRPHIVKWNKICKKKYLSCVPGVDGKIHPSGFVQQGGDSASLVTAYAALRPRDGFSHPHQEHMKDTYNLQRQNSVKITKHTPVTTLRVITLSSFQKTLKPARFYARNRRVSFKMSHWVNSFKMHAIGKTYYHSLDGYFSGFCNVIYAWNLHRGILHFQLSLLREPCARVRRQTEA